MAWLAEKKRVNRASNKKETYFVLAWRDAAGKVKTKGLGFCTKEEAKQALKVVEGKLAVGEAPEPTPTDAGSLGVEPQGYTLRRYLEEVYLPVVQRDMAPKTYESAKTSVKNLVAFAGDAALHTVDYALVDRYVTTRRAAGRRSRTIIIELRVLRGALCHAVDSGVLPHLPKLPTVMDRDRQPHRFLTAAESVRVLEALRPLDEQPHVVTRGKPPVTRDRLAYLAVLMALNTGMRRNEILSRGWEDVRWDQGSHGVLLVRAKPSIGFQVKTRRERAIPLTPDLRDELTTAHRVAGSPDSGWIFPSPIDPSVPRKAFVKALRHACDRAGLPRIHPHGLRHTWASRLAISGVDRTTLMELGGWTEGRMLDEVYAHTTDARKDEVMAKSGIGVRKL